MHEKRNQELEQIYDRYYDSVFRFCAMIIDYDPQFYSLIEDCIQDTFEKALIHYEGFKDYSNPVGWIALTASNRLKSEIRKQKMHNEYIISLAVNSENMRAFSDGTEHVLDRIALIDRITSIYEMLSQKEKVIFHEYFIKEKKMTEIVEDAGLSLNAVRSGIRRIRKKAQIQNFHQTLLAFWSLFLFGRL